MFWFRSRAGEEIASGKKKQHKPLHPALGCSVEKSATESTKVDGVVNIRKKKEVLYNGIPLRRISPIRQAIPQPVQGSSPAQLLMALNDCAPDTNTEPSTAFLCRCVVAKRQDSQIIHKQPWSQTR